VALFVQLPSSVVEHTALFSKNEGSNQATGTKRQNKAKKIYFWTSFSFIRLIENDLLTDWLEFQKKI
jgi:hypothetical protein